MIVASKNLRTKFSLTKFFCFLPGAQFSISDNTHDRGGVNFPSPIILTTEEGGYSATQCN